LTFLKTALLCGVTAHYTEELIGLMPPKEGKTQWQGRVVPYVKRKVQVESWKNEGIETRSVVEDLKKDKTDAYIKTTKCNLIERTNVDDAFIDGAGASIAKEVRIQFGHYIIAEGEWSNTTRKCGFDKTIDKFGGAIGFIINMTYDKSDPAQKLMQSTRGFKSFPELFAKGIRTEGVEYLKGEVHYIAACIFKQTLVQFGAVRNGSPTNKELLQLINIT